MGYVRHAVHHDLKRNRDLLLHLFGGDSRPLRDDLDVIVRDVGIGFDGKLVERDRTPPTNSRTAAASTRKRFVQREIDELANHLFTPYCSTVFWNTSAFATTWSPGLRPATTSCMLSGSMFPATTSWRRKRPFPSGV